MSLSNLFPLSDRPQSPETLRGITKISPEDVEACEGRWSTRHNAEDNVREQFDRAYNTVSVEVAPSSSVPEYPNNVVNLEDYKLNRQSPNQSQSPNDLDIARGMVDKAYDELSGTNYPKASGF